MGWADSEPDWNRFIALLSPGTGERILDIGAGKGDVAARVVQSSGAEVYAVDPDEKKVASMRAAHPAVKCSVAGAEGLPYPESSFDKAYTTMALHHYADLDRAMRETARVLRHGGLFVILEVNPTSVLGWFFRFFGRLRGERMSLMSREELEARVSRLGAFSSSASATTASGYLIQLTRI